MIRLTGFITLFFILSCCRLAPISEKPLPDNTGPVKDSQTASIERAIEVVQKESGVYLYRYAETIEQIEPRKDFTEKYRVFRQSTIEDLRNLVASNREYEPEFKARCLPMWDTGLEFRDEGKSVMFLFSFRCNTIRYVEGDLFKDFTPQRTAFYKIFQYEINDESAILLEKR